LDSFLGVVLKDFPLLNFDIPLEPCGRDSVRDFLIDVWDDLEEPRKHSSNKATGRSEYEQ
ncbi:9375_t:CDS:2, partial [Paraglomus occultum]